MMKVELIDRVSIKIDNLKAKLPEVVAWTISDELVKLELYIKIEKLSGQVLNARSGDLRESVRNEMTQESSTMVEGRVYSSGVKYAAIHEYGFDGPEEVSAHTRVMTVLFGKPVAPFTVNVRAFTRHMVMPERSYMRSALADRRDEIIAAIRGACSQQMAAAA